MSSRRLQRGDPAQTATRSGATFRLKTKVAQGDISASPLARLPLRLALLLETTARRPTIVAARSSARHRVLHPRPGSPKESPTSPGYTDSLRCGRERELRTVIRTTSAELVRRIAQLYTCSSRGRVAVRRPLPVPFEIPYLEHTTSVLLRAHAGATGCPAEDMPTPAPHFRLSIRLGAATRFGCAWRQARKVLRPSRPDTVKIAVPRVWPLPRRVVAMTSNRKAHRPFPPLPRCLPRSDRSA